MPNEKNEETPEAKLFVIIGAPGEFYMQLTKFRAEKNVLEEIKSTQAIQVPSNIQVPGLQQLPPKMDVLCSAVIVYTDKK